MLWGTLGTSLFGNILAGRGAIAMSHGRGINIKGRGINRAGEGIVRAGYGRFFKKRIFNAASSFN